MAVICPTVLAGSPHTYRQQIERVMTFAERIQIDLMDGDFAPHRSIDLGEVWWPEQLVADIHLMYKRPLNYVDLLVQLKPSLVIVHAEAEGNFFELADALRAEDIKVGLALLKETHISKIEPVLDQVDHVLIFSGDLGSFGGTADLSLLDKVKAVKIINPQIEVGWDGGVNEHNAAALAQGGVDVLNVGGFIQRAEHPSSAYAKLKGLIVHG